MNTNTNKQLSEEDLEYIEDILEDPRNLLGEDDEDIIWEVLKRNYKLIQYVDFPTEAMQLYAVRKDGNCIRDFADPSMDVKIAAIKNNGYALNWIENPEPELLFLAVKMNIDVFKTIEYPSEELQLFAVSRQGMQLEHIKNPSDKVIISALEQNGNALQFVNNPDDEIIYRAVGREPLAIQYVSNPSRELKEFAISKNPEAITVIKNLNEDLIKMAIDLKPEVIRFVDSPSEEIQIKALERNYNLAKRFITNPTEKVKEIIKNHDDNKSYEVKFDNGNPVVIGDPTFLGKLRRFSSNILIVDDKHPWNEIVKVDLEEFGGHNKFSRTILESYGVDEIHKIDNFEHKTKPSLSTIREKKLISKGQRVLILGK